MGKISVLDCTLRDGAYIVNSMFGDNAIKGIIGKLKNSGIELIECGWLKDKKHESGSTFYHLPDDVLDYIGSNKKECKYVAMIDWNRFDTSSLPICDHSSLDAIRVVFPYEHYKEGVEVGRLIKEKGYDVYFQAANTLAYSNDDLKELALFMNDFKPVALSVVDTFGAMYEDDLQRILYVLDSSLDTSIELGFHSHNNQQLAFSNSIYFANYFRDKERDIIIDSSLCGMGRGAGNATTELICNYLNQKFGTSFDMDSILDAIDVYIKRYAESFSWGYSTEYCIAGMYCCHVNNIAYLTENHRTTAKDMRGIIESLTPEDRKKYDYNLLESKYIENQNRKIDDEVTFNQLTDEFAGKKVLLVAPGKSSLDYRSEILKFISDNPDVITVSVNALLDGYSNKYLFLTNYARYEYAKNNHSKDFENCEKILLSSVKIEADVNEYIVGFERAIKRGWDHFDNAVICALRLMKRLGIKKIYLSGFDGFKETYNESYADKELPTVNPGKKWEELNEEIKDMFNDFRSKSPEIEIEFLTPSMYQ